MDSVNPDNMNNRFLVHEHDIKEASNSFENWNDLTYNSCHDENADVQLHEITTRVEGRK